MLCCICDRVAILIRLIAQMQLKFTQRFDHILFITLHEMECDMKTISLYFILRLLEDSAELLWRVEIHQHVAMHPLRCIDRDLAEC